MISSRVAVRRRYCVRPNPAHHLIRTKYYSTTSLTTGARRFITSPPLFLLHLSGISFGTFFIALVGARNNSSKATAAREARIVETDSMLSEDTVLEEEIEGDGIDRIAPPQPSPKQLRDISSVLRQQIGSTSRGIDGLFTLRQLHMIRRPQLSLPLPLSETCSVTYRREPWLWRLPAAASIHAIVRRNDTSLIGAAVRLASNALTWDQMMRVVVEGKIQKPFLVGPGFTLRSPTVFTRRSTSTSTDSNSSPDPGSTQAKPALTTPATIPSNLTGPIQLSPQVPTKESTISASSLDDESISTMAPAAPEPTSNERHVVLPASSSLRPQTLELLFLFLARTPGRSHQTALVALSIALACSRLGIIVSERMHWHTVKICLDLDRIDLACHSWAVWLEQSKGSKKQSKGLLRTLEKFKQTLRPKDKKFVHHPSLKMLAAIATLARTLERQTDLEDVVTSTIVHVLASFPPRRYSRTSDGQFLSPELLEGGTYRSHEEVFNLVNTVINGKLELILRRRILFSSATGYFIDTTHPESATLSPALSIHAFNNFLLYSLRRLRSPDIANQLLNILTQRGITPTAATHNILLQHTTLNGLQQFNPNDRLENIRSFPTFIAYLTKVSNFISIDRIIFSLLKELEVASTGVDEIPGGVPPPPGRNKYLYVTLLNALQKSGRTGLAERVFRQARWAAALSRTRDDEPSWVLPPAAFSMMLNLYASEAMKGNGVRYDQASGRDRTKENDFVKGWGRHALRVFFHKQRQERLTREFGASVEIRSKRSERDRSIPAVLRSTAAPVVAIWELQGGSEELELRSLRTALTSRFAKRAVDKLFPPTRVRRDGSVKEGAHSDSEEEGN
jgi:hypothetical protein